MTYSRSNRLLQVVTAGFLALGIASAWGGFAFNRNPGPPVNEPPYSVAPDSSAAATTMTNPVERRARDGVVHATAFDFDEYVLKSNVPVIVDFYAEWCGPCQLQAPVLDELARETDTVRIVKVNVDENAELVERYGIRSLPTLLVFNNGKEVNHLIGYASKEQLKTIVPAT